MPIQRKLLMAWYVYIVECFDKSFYTGICWNLKKRITSHNNGRYQQSFTRSRLPVKLVYWRKFIGRYKAAKEEKIIKGYSRFKKQKLVNSLHRTK